MFLERSESFDHQWPWLSCSGYHHQLYLKALLKQVTQLKQLSSVPGSGGLWWESRITVSNMVPADGLAGWGTTGSGTCVHTEIALDLVLGRRLGLSLDPQQTCKMPVLLNPALGKWRQEDP